MFASYIIKRTPEQGHTKECLAKALIEAVENLRDMDGQTDLDFRLYVQDNTPLLWADMYLSEGMLECLCDPVGVGE